MRLASPVRPSGLDAIAADGDGDDAGENSPLYRDVLQSVNQFSDPRVDVDRFRPRDSRRLALLDYGRVLVEFTVLVGCGSVLRYLGGGDGSFFRCDLAAVIVCLSSSLILGIIAIVRFVRRPGGAWPWGYWEQLATIFMHINSLCFLFLALLGHALPVLLQILTLVSDIVWMLFCLSFSAWAWRKGVQAPETGELPLMQLCLRLPKMILLGVWAFFTALSIAVLFFKPLEKSGLDPELGRIEHFLLTSLGSMFISSFLGILYLWLVPAGRELLVFTGVRAGHRPTQTPTGCTALIRASLTSVCATLFSAMFPAVCFYSMVTVVVLALAWLSLHWSIVPEGKKKKKKEHPESPTKKRIRKSNRNSNHKVEPVDEVVDLTGDAIAKSPRGMEELPRYESSKKIQEKPPATTCAKVKKWAGILAFILFGFSKVALIFVAFMFDVVFIQKALTTIVSRKFVLVKHDATCGNTLHKVSDVLNPEACALDTQAWVGKKKHGRAFMYNNDDQACSIQDIVVGNVMYKEFKEEHKVCPSGNWTIEQGTDFYALEPAQSCSFTSRRLKGRALEEEDLTVDGEHKSSTADHMDEGGANFFEKIGMPGVGNAFKDAMNWCMGAMRKILSIKFGMPRDMLFKCKAARRLISGAMILGAVVAMAAVAALDILSVIAAAKEITAVRAGELDSFMAYLIFSARPQVIEFVVIMILQITITSARRFEADAWNIFKDSCGAMIKSEHLSGLECPNIWHLPVDMVATGIVFFSLAGGILLCLIVFAGLQYGLPPTQWAVDALFGRYLHLAKFVAEPDSASHPVDEPVHSLSRSKTRVLGKKEMTHRDWAASNCLRPIMGIPVSFGLWTTWTSRGFQVGRRQDWYEPVEANAGKEDHEANTELVSWKSMYQATSKVLSLAWLIWPMGLLLSKGCLYLNEFVIFAYGADDGGSRDPPKPIAQHFLGNTPEGVQMLHWMSQAMQFAIIVAIEFDLLPEEHDAKIRALTICILVVVGIAAFRAGAEFFEELAVFTRNKGVITAMEDLIEEREIFEILNEGPAPEDGGEWLKWNCKEHRETVYHACTELATLEWLAKDEPELTKKHKSVLRSNRIASHKRYREVQDLTFALARDDSQEPIETALRGELILLLHLSVEHEIQATRCRMVSRRYAVRLCNWESKEKAKYLQQWAVAQAKLEAIHEASARQKMYEDSVKRIEELKRRGIRAEMPAEPVCRLQLVFAVAATSVAKVTGRWVHNDLDLLDHPVEVSSTVSVRGEVSLTWSKDLRHDKFDQDLVTMKNPVVHSITPHGWTEAEMQDLLDAGDDLTALGPGGQAFNSHLNIDENGYSNQNCEMCVHDLKKYGKGCCKSKCCSKKNMLRSKKTQHLPSHHDWKLANLGVAWNRDVEYVEQELSRDRSSDFKLGGGSVKHARNHEEAAWLHEVSPAPMSVQATAGAADSLEAVRALEQALLRDVGQDPRWVAGAFIGALHAESDDLSAEEAAQRSRAMALASRMIRKKPSARSNLAPVEQVPNPIPRESNPYSPSMTPLQKLRAALARDPIDADELSLAIDVARRQDVDPLVLEHAEETFFRLLAKQRAALNLVEAIESRMIGNLRKCLAAAVEAGIHHGEFKDASNVGVIDRAEQCLEEEKSKAANELQEALKSNGALRLQRAISQAEQAGGFEELIRVANSRLESIGERKRQIALLKLSLASKDVGLLKAAIEECEKHAAYMDECDTVDLNVAKKRLEELEHAAQQLKEDLERKRAVEREIEQELALVAVGDELFTPSTIVPVSKAKSAGPLAQFRATAALRTALYADPPEAMLLRIAIQQAQMAGVQNEDLDHAMEIVQREESKEKQVDALRKAAAARDIRALGGVLEQCRESGVDARKMLVAVSQLLEEQAKVARRAGGHGIGNVVLADLEKERRDLHNSLQEAKGAIRVVCRVRPFVTQELWGAPSDTITSSNGASSFLPAPPTLRSPTRASLGVSPSLSMAGSATLSGARRADGFRPPRFGTLVAPAGPPDASLPQVPKHYVRKVQEPAVVRVDKHTVCIYNSSGERHTFRTGGVYGPDCVQAELWSEVRSLVQSAVDGYNVSIIACGPKGAGKTFTLLGARAESRGILPRFLDDLFAIRDRDTWRASLKVEVQLVEIYDSKRMWDLLNRGRSTAMTPPQASSPKIAQDSLVRHSSSRLNLTSGFTSRAPPEGHRKIQAWGSPTNTPRGFGREEAPPQRGYGRQETPPSGRSSPADQPNMDLASVMTRRVADKLELQRVLDENWTNPLQPGRARHVLAILHLTRTNRATGVKTQSKVIAADVAAIGPDASPEIKEAHKSLQGVLEALAEQQLDVPFESHALTRVLGDCMGGSSKTMMLLALSPAPADAEASLATLSLAPAGTGQRPG